MYSSTNGIGGVPGACAGAAVKQRELVTPPGSLWLFRGLVLDLFLERLPGGFIPDKTLLIGFLLAGCHKPRLAFGNFGPGFRLFTHNVYLSLILIYKVSTKSCFDIRALLDFSACCNLLFTRIADKQYLEPENDFPAA